MISSRLALAGLEIASKCLQINGAREGVTGRVGTETLREGQFGGKIAQTYGFSLDTLV